MRLARLALVPLALAWLGACAPASHAPRWASVLETTPGFLATQPAFDPALTAGSNGRVALTWVSRDSTGADVWLALSRDSGATFAAPVRLNARAGSVTSFPESHPVAAFGPGGHLVVAWAAARDSGPPADDIVARTSEDEGTHFGPERVLNDDPRTPAGAYHGFVTLAFTAAGRAVAAWIDGRNSAHEPGEAEPAVAEIWSSTSEDGGRTWRANVCAARGVCPCCGPALRNGPQLLALAYRANRDSIRDPRLALSRDGGATWALDTLVAADGWKLPGCPVSGLALACTPGGGWVAWFTGAEHAGGTGAGVYAAQWTSAGEVGPRCALADSAGELARPLLVSLGGDAMAGALARQRGGRHAVVLRTLAPDGAASTWLPLGANASAAALAAIDARRVLAAWIEQADSGPRLRVARVTLR